jgi:hypothetical protein
MRKLSEVSGSAKITRLARRLDWDEFSVAATLAKSVGISRLSDDPHALGERGYEPDSQISQPGRRLSSF